MDRGVLPTRRRGHRRLLRNTALGADGLVIEDEADFRRFLEENRQYWDYVDEELEARYRGVSASSSTLRTRRRAGHGSPPSRMARARARVPSRSGRGLGRNWKQYYKPIEIGESCLSSRLGAHPENPGRLILRLDPLACLSAPRPRHHQDVSLRPLRNTRGLEVRPGPRLRQRHTEASAHWCSAAPTAPAATWTRRAPSPPPKTPRSTAYARASTRCILATSSLTPPAPELGAGYDIVLANIVSDVIIPSQTTSRGFMSIRACS